MGPHSLSCSGTRRIYGIGLAPTPLLLGSEQDVDQIVEAITKIQGNIDELLRADDKLIERKQMSCVERPRDTL